MLAYDFSRRRFRRRSSRVAEGASSFILSGLHSDPWNLRMRLSLIFRSANASAGIGASLRNRPPTNTTPRVDESRAAHQLRLGAVRRPVGSGCVRLDELLERTKEAVNEQWSEEKKEDDRCGLLCYVSNLCNRSIPHNRLAQYTHPTSVVVLTREKREKNQYSRGFLPLLSASTAAQAQAVLL
jgi:hypothetical protein